MSTIVKHWINWSEEQTGLYEEIHEIVYQAKHVENYTPTDREILILMELRKWGIMEGTDGSMVPTEKGKRFIARLETEYALYIEYISTLADDTHFNTKSCSNCGDGGCVYCMPNPFF